MGRGKAPAKAIRMSKRQKYLLTKLSRNHNTAQQIAKRAKLLLLAGQGINNVEVSRQIKISYSRVLSWRKRWLDQYDSLLAFETGLAGEPATDLKLSERLLKLLKDSQRSGAPKMFSLEQKQQLIALACENPQDYGLQITDWTYEMLAKTAIAKMIVETISPSHLGKILKK